MITRHFKSTPVDREGINRESQWFYDCGMAQGKADVLGDDIRNEVARHEVEMDRIRSLSGQNQVTSAAVATSEETNK